MKIIEINIGLASKTQGKLNHVEVLNALTGRGFSLLKYHVASSVCKDGEEPCLAVKVECPEDWQTQLAGLSDKLGQDCVAVVGFIGHAPYDAFCADLWKSPETIALSDCQAIQAKHKAQGDVMGASIHAEIFAKLDKARAEREGNQDGTPACTERAEGERFNDFTRQEFLAYLEFTIIPDSRGSGFEGYAEDLETALHFLRNP